MGPDLSVARGTSNDMSGAPPRGASSGLVSETLFPLSTGLEITGAGAGLMFRDQGRATHQLVWDKSPIPRET